MEGLTSLSLVYHCSMVGMTKDSYIFLEDKGKLSQFQHGFRHGRSNNSGLAKLSEQISKIWEGRQEETGTFLYIEKKFDSLGREI